MGLLALILAVGGGPMAPDIPPQKVRAEFRALTPCPSTWRTTGPCPGYGIVLNVPRCAGGRSEVSNLTWLRNEDRTAKAEADVKRCR